MGVFLLRSKRGARYAKIIQRAIQKSGVRCYLDFFKNAEKKIQRFGLRPEEALIHSRTAGPHANRVIERLESRRFRVINPSRTLDLTSNKFKAHEHAVEHGIPVAPTIKVKKTDTAAIERFLQEHQDIVLKPIFSQGQGVYCSRISKSSAKVFSKSFVQAPRAARHVERAWREEPQENAFAEDLFSTINSSPGTFLQVQQFISYRRLIRVIVINFKAIPEATVYDEPLPGEWKCSVCLNPRIKKLDNPPAELMTLAEQTARAFDARVNFIDFFETESGRFILNEINTACNLIRHETVTGVPIHEKIAEFLVSHI